MIKVGIVGGAGYTAGELLRLLVNHPSAEIVFAQSNSQAKLPVTDIHTDLIGDTDLHFVKNVTEEVDVVFLCSGHGKSKSFLASHSFSANTKIIDLSNDFRLNKDADGFVYGLPELNRDKIIKANKIANPGCFATAIQLALLPLANKQLLNNEIHINAITGSTGAGQNPTPTSHFSWRNNNVSIYKAFSHQHLGEIGESLTQCQSNFNSSINFLPVRGNFTRGIFASLYTKLDLELEAAQKIYSDYYQSHPFVNVVTKGPNLKQVVNTNKCILSIEKHDDKILIISTIDNLIKGASGQAIQNMNLMFGLTENTGLQLKSGAF